MKRLLYIAFISIGLSLNLSAAVIEGNSLEVQNLLEKRMFPINQLFNNTHLRNIFLINLFGKLNNDEIKELKIKLIICGNKELLNHINAFFNDKIPSVLKWRWFGLKSPVTLENNFSELSSLLISQDYTFIVTVSKDNTAKIWDNRGELIKTLEGYNESIL